MSAARPVDDIAFWSRSFGETASNFQAAAGRRTPTGFSAGGNRFVMPLPCPILISFLFYVLKYFPFLHLSRPYLSSERAGLSPFRVQPAGGVHMRDRWPAGVSCARSSAGRRCAPAASLVGGVPPRDHTGSSTGQRGASAGLLAGGNGTNAPHPYLRFFSNLPSQTFFLFCICRDPILLQSLQVSPLFVFDWQGPHICKIAGRPVYFCDLRRAGDMPRGIVGLGQASAGSCGIRMGRQRAPAGSLSEGNQVRCPLIPVHFLFYFSFKTSSLFLLVATISSSCFRRSLPFYLVFDCRGAYICAITGRPVYFCGLFGGPEAGG